ncbi:polysaccharide pyruvyl transferase family protein [Arthrobacter agilis]|uniref:polysaccharide pyruvyl transferase family protein n=1 Tax=Arthrobacter agilis TaxID=37921 RepID=UPI00277E1876|nr:polysaccharide pyruvyl transferase family protein [Arthrobacter agilis]MDQ0734081.1 polysaccharide pyruvyl transferase WcaK-like protein [Arthrobacter agilis]
MAVVRCPGKPPGWARMGDVKVAVLGDVGQSIYHVGDEAMTHAAIDELRGRGIDDIVVLTRNVQVSGRAFESEAVPTLTFPWPPRERSDFLRRVLAVAQDDRNAHAETDAILDFIEHLRQCDALLVAGGGNMNSLYGWLLYERVAAVRIARALGLRVVVSGQTLGPDLHGPDRDAARTLLESADLTGARESDSLQLMRDLAPDAAVRPCLDDASFMAVAGRENAPASRLESTGKAGDLPAGPYIAATISPGHGEVDREAYLSALASALDDASELTGHPVVFLPHMATPGEGDVDEHMHQDIAARMRSRRVVLLPIQDAYRTLDLTRDAALVITSRYHPVVFALEAGVPVVALVAEAYSDVRIRGALHNWGLENLALTLPSLLDGTLTEAVNDVWARRDVLSSYLAAARASRLDRHRQWWDDVASTLGGRTPDSVPASLEVHALPSFDPAWQARAAASALVFLPTAAASTMWRIENEHLRGEVEALAGERDDARDELSAWFESRSFKLARKVAAVASVTRRRR